MPSMTSLFQLRIASCGYWSRVLICYALFSFLFACIMFWYEFQALVSSLETKIQETEQKFEETSALSEERLKKILEAESNIVESESKLMHLKTSMQRFI